RQVEALAEHVDAYNDAAVAVEELVTVLTTGRLRHPCVDANGSELGANLLVQLDDLLRPFDRSNACHQKMVESRFEVRPQLLHRRDSDRPVGVSQVDH